MASAAWGQRMGLGLVGEVPQAPTPCPRRSSSTLPVPLEKRKLTGAIPWCAQQKVDTDAITKRRDNWFSDDNSTWLMGRETPVCQAPG